MASLSVKGKIVSINTSPATGERKKPVPEVTLIPERGIAGDAHGLNQGAVWHRQVSLLALESIEKMRQKGLSVGPGDFAENLTTEGLDLLALPLGTRLKLGPEVILEITQHGKVCHDRCAIYYQAGDCVMPREGIFAKVLVGGHLRPGDAIETLKEE